MVDEEELEKLKEERQQELSSSDSEAETEEQMEKQRKQLWEQAKDSMTGDAASRLGNIKAVDEEKAMAVAQQIVRLGRTGQVGEIDDSQMKEILKSVDQGGSDQSDIKFRN